MGSQWLCRWYSIDDDEGDRVTPTTEERCEHDWRFLRKVYDAKQPGGDLNADAFYCTKCLKRTVR